MSGRSGRGVRAVALLTAGAALGGLVAGCTPDPDKAVAAARDALTAAGSGTVKTLIEVTTSASIGGTSSVGIGATSARRFGAHPAADSKVPQYYGAPFTPSADARIIEVNGKIYQHGFTTTPPTDGKPWQPAGDTSDGAAGLVPLLDPMTFLSGGNKNVYQGVNDKGPAKVDGTDTEHYTMLCANENCQFDVGPMPEKASGGTLQVQAEMWLDGDNRPRKLTAHYLANSASGTGQTDWVQVDIQVTMTFTGIGKKVTVTPPPAAQTDG